MRKRLIKGIALVAVLAAAGIAAILYFGPSPRIDDASLAQIRQGMTLAQVERLIGAPAGDYGFGNGELMNEVFWPVLDRFQESATAKVWRGQDMAIVVEFDEDGRAKGQTKLIVYRPYESCWDMLLQKLKLRQPKPRQEFIW